ncbi:MAG: substrate-binding domain-containing protein [Nitrospira sp.]
MDGLRGCTVPSRSWLPLELGRMMPAKLFVSGLFIGLLLCQSPAFAVAQTAGSLAIAGNGPEQATIEALARAFEKANPRAYIDILWDEDSKPLQLVKTGHAQIAVTGAEDPALMGTQIGWDGIGILVHLSNFTKEVTKQQAADIFSGKIKEWSELGGPETKILLIDRPHNQNIREAFESQLGIPGKIPGNAKVIGGDETVVKTVVGTLPPLSAASYISLSTGLSVVSGGVAVRLLQVDKVEPEIPTVKDGRYSLRRPLLLLANKEPNPLVDAFTKFALSPPGQAIIGETYVPMPSK